MSPKPPLLSGRKFVKILENFGYEKVSQRGSHIKMKNDVTGTVAIVPNHKELDRWTLKIILKQIDLSEEKLKEYL